MAFQLDYNNKNTTLFKLKKFINKINYFEYNVNVEFSGRNMLISFDFRYIPEQA